LPEFDPEDIARAAVESGFRATGFTVKPETWTDTTTKRVQDILRGTGVEVLDVEPVWIGADGVVNDGHRHILDVGQALGAKNALIVSSCTDEVANRRAFEQLAIHSEKCGLRACFEFLRITAVTRLSQALSIVEDVGHPAGGVLVDSIHLARCGEFDRLASVDPKWMPYAQFCDGRATCGEDYQSLLNDAVDERLLPGEGALPLREALAIFRPDLPLALEIRSRALRENYPDPVNRARRVLEQANQYFGY
jgi:sugar phosphate isomerase/epimerase